MLIRQCITVHLWQKSKRKDMNINFLNVYASVLLNRIKADYVRSNSFEEHTMHSTWKNKIFYIMSLDLTYSILDRLLSVKYNSLIAGKYWQVCIERMVYCKKSTRIFTNIAETFEEYKCNLVGIQYMTPDFFFFFNL